MTETETADMLDDIAFDLAHLRDCASDRKLHKAIGEAIFYLKQYEAELRARAALTPSQRGGQS